MNKILIYGAGDFGFVVKNLLRYTKYEFAGFISDISTGKEIVGNFEYVRKNYNKNDFGVALAIGYSDLGNRRDIFNNVRNEGYTLPPIIHRESYACNSVSLKEGSILMSGCNIDYNSIIGEIAVIWPGTVISHDCFIGSNTFLSPNATICGFAKVGNNCFIGAGAVIVDRSEVPDNSFIKAASLYKEKKL